jgi:hypothetical protein
LDSLNQGIRCDNWERMRLYSGTTKSLIEDSTFNRIAPKLKDAFFNEFRYQPSVAEVNSWNNSLRAISQVFQTASFLFPVPLGVELYEF